jgi:hypothetical protein
VRAVATGEPELAQKVAAFHTHLEDLIAAALRGEPLSAAAAPTPEERRLADVLQHVWFSSLIGWSAGLHGQNGIVDDTRAAAELLLRGSGL